MNAGAAVVAGSAARPLPGETPTNDYQIGIIGWLGLIGGYLTDEAMAVSWAR